MSKQREMRRGAGLVQAAALMVAVWLCGCTMTVCEQPRPRPRGRAVGWHRRHAPAAGVRLVIIEGTGIQFVAGSSEDIFCYNHTWYRFGGGLWFTAGSYGGPWVRIAAPPAAFRRIPPGHAKAHVNAHGGFVAKAHKGRGGKPKRR